MTDLPTADPVLANLTTLRVGGPAERLIEARDTDELVAATLDVWADGDEWMILGGGSNIVAADEGFAGTVIRTANRGIAELPGEPGRVRLRVEAGEGWDDLVAATVERGLAGMEALSGIPGSVGAAPIQNIGAYGQEAADTLVAVHFLDYLTGDEERIPAGDLALGYRTSIFKQGRQGVVTAVEFDLEPGEGSDGVGAPVRYAQLASALGVELGARAPLGAVRNAVLGLRRSKGMVLAPDDPESVSAGSFFTNPMVTERFSRTLPDDAPRWPVRPEDGPVVVPLGEAAQVPIAQPALVEQPQDEPSVKLSAAWLIERAGVSRGFALPGSRASVSRKHTLALVNRGGATAEEVLELARYIQAMVQSEFGVLLRPEPLILGSPL
jgi:UDP-N-acetylmuramate dehydrogenase